MMIKGQAISSAVSVCFYLVGADGFEPPTSCSQSRRATRLRHAPNVRIVAGSTTMLFLFAQDY